MAEVTVKEMIPMLGNATRVDMSWNGTLVSFDFTNSIEVEVWGEYVVDSVRAVKEGVFELVLAARLIKKEAQKV